MHNYFRFMPKHDWPQTESEHVMAILYAPALKLAHCRPNDVGTLVAAGLFNAERFDEIEIDLASDLDDWRCSQDDESRWRHEDQQKISQCIGDCLY